jgi:hypothetical protein
LTPGAVGRPVMWGSGACRSMPASGAIVKAVAGSAVVCRAAGREKRS